MRPPKRDYVHVTWARDEAFVELKMDHERARVEAQVCLWLRLDITTILSTLAVLLNAAPHSILAFRPRSLIRTTYTTSHGLPLFGSDSISV